VLVLSVAVLRATLGLLLIAAPNELLVLSGRRHRLADGRIVGYRIVRGGRALRLPFLERADWLELTNQVILIEIPDCHAKDGSHVAIEAVAHVKIAGELPIAANAVERFLGRSRADGESCTGLRHTREQRKRFTRFRSIDR
jgi:flotillin